MVLDERPSIKGDGLRLSGRLLVDGCAGGGEGGGDEITSINRRVQLSELQAVGRGGGGGQCLLINGKGTTDRTHKVNGKRRGGA